MSLESVYTVIPVLFNNAGLENTGKNDADTQKTSSTASKLLSGTTETDIDAAALEIFDSTWDLSTASPTLLATARADELLAPGSTEPAAGTFKPYRPSSPPLPQLPAFGLDIQRQLSTSSSTSSTGSLQQSLSRSGTSRHQGDDGVHSEADRSAREVARQLHAFQELLDTERRYVRDLGILIEIFLSPLASVIWITGEQKRAVIRNAWVIRGCHSLLLKQLDGVITDIIDKLSTNLSLTIGNINVNNKTDYNNNSNNIEKDLPSLPKDITLGQIFLDQAADFQSYVEYCSGHDTTLRVLTQLAENAKWRSYTESCKERLRNQRVETRLTLHDYLIKPVQRLCQYPITMREIISFYKEGTKEHTDLMSAIEMLRGVATSIDDAKHLEEARQRTQVFFSRVDEVSLSTFPGISHYKDDGLLLAGALEFVDYSRKPKLCIKYYGCFVFPGLLLVTRARRAKTYHIIHRFALTEMMMCELDASQSLLKFPWRLKCSKTQQNYDFGAAGKQERKLWLDLLSRYTTQLRLRHKNDSTSSLDSMASDFGLERSLSNGNSHHYDTKGDPFTGSSDSATLVDALACSRRSRGSSRSDDSTASNATLPTSSTLTTTVRPTGLNRRYSHGNHDFQHSSVRKYASDGLSTVNERSNTMPITDYPRDNSLVRRILPLRRTQSVEFRGLPTPPPLLISPSDANTPRSNEPIGPPSPLRSNWSFRSSSGTEATPARRATIEQRFEDVFTQDHQTVHALEMRLQVVAAEQRRVQQLQEAEENERQLRNRNSMSVIDSNRLSAKRRTYSDNYSTGSINDQTRPPIPVRTSSLRQTSLPVSNNSIEKSVLKIAHHSLSLTLSSVRLTTPSTTSLNAASSTLIANTTNDISQHDTDTNDNSNDIDELNTFSYRPPSINMMSKSCSSSPLMRPRPKRINSLLFSSSLKINTDVATGSSSSSDQQTHQHQRSLSLQRSTPQLRLGGNGLRTVSQPTCSGQSSPMNEEMDFFDTDRSSKSNTMTRLLRNTFRRARPQSTPPPSPSSGSLRGLVSTPFMSRSTTPTPPPRPPKSPLSNARLLTTTPTHHITSYCDIDTISNSNSESRCHSTLSLSSYEQHDHYCRYNTNSNNNNNHDSNTNTNGHGSDDDDTHGPISAPLLSLPPLPLSSSSPSVSAPSSPLCPLGMRHGNLPIPSARSPVS
ncbi:hypothetical protein BDF19DRAFT_431845 [Syncephalis fuscata]|nr:hypothetical protein BDF19DRAFT_431845 [Syncephalis fuscata]